MRSRREEQSVEERVLRERAVLALLFDGPCPAACQQNGQVVVIVAVSVAAIALACGSCYSAIAQDLPEPLILHLENGACERDFLRAQDRQLLSIFRKA